MATHNNADLIEEDAADLQFPKESTSNPTENLDLHLCYHCHNDLSDKFIMCVVCDILICVNCFAHGAEFASHKNEHSYKILNYNFVLFEQSDWTAKEELTLIEGLRKYRNWHRVSYLLPNRTLEQIKEHYEYYYIDRNGSDMFPKLRSGILYNKTLIPYRFKVDDIVDPIRYLENAPAGYNAPRAEFANEYDSNAEKLVASLQTLDEAEPYYELMSNLQASIVNSYRRRLHERLRRRKIIREHGLVMPHLVNSWLLRYHATISKEICDKLICFIQFYTAEGFANLMEGLHRAGELKMQIARLCEYRRHGITSLEEGGLYERLRKRHETSAKEIKRFQHLSELNFNMRAIPLPLTVNNRRVMKPLDVSGMIGYEKLTVNERELCKVARLPPLTYLELKAILVAENTKCGYVHLKNARRLLKIDVNKTRKLYDFLVQDGFITAPKD